MLAKVNPLRWEVSLLFCVFIELARRGVCLLKSSLINLIAR